ncbi:response regulator [Devosia sp.]|uniref:response regulator transcription factor n=1 Tax=Devosia sp. TaxID=1871048 RepID=UPI00262C4447|nr:response regulator [Devosia sp.]
MRAHLRITTLSRVPTVSIVDDDDSVRGATARFVRLHGFLVHAFASAEEFLQSAVVDETACLITDVQMPGMSGYELQRRLIADGRRIPVIFITAFPQEGSRAKALKAGAIGFLTKPFDGNTLIGRLREAMKTG